MSNPRLVLDFAALRMKDVADVGGKNASLGEMMSQLGGAGVRVPGGFATTAHAYREFLAQGGLDQRVAGRLRGLDVSDIPALSRAGEEIRSWILAQELPRRLQQDIADAYRRLVDGAGADATFAVRSSATAEDLPDASFAGQQETLLNVHGIDNLYNSVKQVFASLYNDRAISYRVHKGFTHDEVALSAGIQRMVRSNLGASGVAFTLDTESGFDQVVLITSSYGLGETIVQGKVNPDEFYVYKRALREGKHAILRRGLGSKAIKMVYADSREPGQSVTTVNVPEPERRRFSISDAEVEELARYAMIIEDHYRRPMDIEWGRDGVDGKLYILQARPETVKAAEKVDTLRRYRLKSRSEVLATGRAIGQKIGSGPVRVIRDAAEMSRVREGDVLVTDMTDPDWEPVMKRTAAIVTNRGGRTCHAAIIARMIGVHPRAVLAYPDLGSDLKVAVEEHSAGYPDPVTFYVSKLAEGIATLGAAFWPKPVIVRLSDFKSNEYSALTGGARYEPREENPMLGFRGAGRYLDPTFRDCFQLECRALKKVRDDMGLTNIEIMVPFVRTVGEARKVLELLAANGLKRGESGLRVIMMCEIPSNAILADQFLEHFDGFSIGSNDMTQLTLGLDRDSGIIAEHFDERDPAVKQMLHLAIQACRRAGKYVGICGQGPSDHPDLAKWLVEEGIESISLNPDTVVETWLYLAREAVAAKKA